MRALLFRRPRASAGAHSSFVVRALFTLTMALSLCGCAPPKPPAYGIVRIRGPLPPRATVWVDEESLGSAEVIGTELPLRPGVHRITLDARGYFPSDHEVIVPENGATDIRPELLRNPEVELADERDGGGAG